MKEQRATTLDLVDDRSFSLIEYRHGHSHAVLRGFPDQDDDPPGGGSARVLDVFFPGVERIDCWKDLGPVRIRRADEAERAALEGRIGRIREDSGVYLLQEGSTESYVIAARAYWAEFDVPYGAQSPFTSEDPGCRAAHPPVEGLVRYAGPAG